MRFPVVISLVSSLCLVLPIGACGEDATSSPIAAADGSAVTVDTGPAAGARI